MKALAFYFALFAFLLFSFKILSVRSGRPIFTVLTYSSMSSEWGAGPTIEFEFEKTCNCDVIFRAAGDANLILQRLKVEPHVDIVMGLDQLSIDRAKTEYDWWKFKVPAASLYHPVAFNRFVPFDWAPMTFVGRGKERQPLVFTELQSGGKIPGQIALQDPLTSSPGMQLFYWVTEGVAEPIQLAQNLKRLAHSISPGWSSSYGLFQKGQADLVFSYTTSPIYHQLEEKKDDYFAYRFDRPLPVQVEYLAIPKGARDKRLSEKFIQLVLSEKVQTQLMFKNYMLPSSKQVKIPKVFEQAMDFEYSQVSIPSREEIDKRVKAWRKSR